METHQEELPSLMNTLNMNFKCWPSLLLVMDQTVLLFSGQQWKMVGTINSLTNILINSTIVLVEIRAGDFTDRFKLLPFKCRLQAQIVHLASSIAFFLILRRFPFSCVGLNQLLTASFEDLRCIVIFSWD